MRREVLAIPAAACLLLSSLAISATAAHAEVPHVVARLSCSAPSISLDVAAAARLKVRVGKKGAVPLGLPQAQQIAGALTPRLDADVICDSTPSPPMQAQLDEISTYIDSGDWQGAVSLLEAIIGSVDYTAQSATSARRMSPRVNSGDGCRGIDKTRDFQMPDGVSDALAAAEFAARQAEAAENPEAAQAFEAQSQAAVAAAQGTLKAYIDNGADGASSAADWLAIAAAGQMIGMDESSAVATALSKARSAALTSYRIQVKAKCKATSEVSCMGRAVAAFDMLGGSDAEVGQMTQEFGRSAMEAANPVKSKECRGELYIFRYSWKTSLSGTSGDTGPIRLRIIDDKIVFQNIPVIRLVGGGHLAIYSAKTGGVLDTGTYLGGEWPLSLSTSAQMSRVTPNSVTLSPYFGRGDNDTVMYHTSWKCPICVIGYELDPTELWAKNDAALQPILDLLAGIELPRRKSATRTLGGITWYWTYDNEDRLY